jgi:hypothetical protein
MPNTRADYRDEESSCTYLGELVFVPGDEVQVLGYRSHVAGCTMREQVLGGLLLT